MNSMKVLSFLLVVGLSQSAPQISQQGLVGQVLGQLQPTIQRIVASSLGSRGSAGSSGFSQRTPALSQRTPAFSQRTPAFSQGSNFGSSALSQSSSFNQGSSSSSGLSASQLTSSVVSSLQPAIAAAVADALRSRQSRPTTSSVSALSPEEEASINARQSANAQYNYEYKVGDDDKQNYISHKEARNGENVEGMYNYVDPTGSLVTVNYQAGPEGYTETREVQEGAVQIDARNIPEPWTGPLAGVSSSSSSGASSSSSSGPSQSDLIAQILRAVQPQISRAVQSAVGSRTNTASSSFSTGGASRLSSANLQSSRRGFNSEANIISSVIGALQPQISGAVQSAIGRSRPAPRRPAAPRPAPASGVNDLFGGSGVRIQTPEFNIQY